MWVPYNETLDTEQPSRHLVNEEKEGIEEKAQCTALSLRICRLKRFPQGQSPKPGFGNKEFLWKEIPESLIRGEGK